MKWGFGLLGQLQHEESEAKKGLEETDKKLAEIEADGVFEASVHAEEEEARRERWAREEATTAEEARRVEKMLEGLRLKMQQRARVGDLSSALKLDDAAWAAWIQEKSTCSTAEVPWPRLEAWMVEELKTKRKSVWNTMVKRWEPTCFIKKYSDRLLPGAMEEVRYMAKEVESWTRDLLRP